jgi:hypothetical protein
MRINLTMAIRLDLKNKRFGRLIVLKDSGKRNYGTIVWECQCECGNFCFVTSSNLNYGTTSSCGCHKAELDKRSGIKSRGWKGHEGISLSFFNAIKHNAKKRNIDFKITISYIWDLYLFQNKKCSISGVDIKFKSNHRTPDGTVSLDRIDSSKGYIKGNVQWIHKDLQKMKWEFEENKFYEWIKIIYQNKFGKNIS